MITITLCMGSSCFSRGNAQSLQILENYLSENNLESRINLVGNHCLENCSRGPNIKINDRNYSSLLPEGVIDTLNYHLNEQISRDSQ